MKTQSQLEKIVSEEVSKALLELLNESEEVALPTPEEAAKAPPGAADLLTKLEQELAKNEKLKKAQKEVTKGILDPLAKQLGISTAVVDWIVDYMSKDPGLKGDTSSSSALKDPKNPKIPVNKPASPKTYSGGSASNVGGNLTQWKSLVKKAAEKYDLPEPMIYAVMRKESGGRLRRNGKCMRNDNAGGVSTDWGLMQINNRAHASWFRKRGCTEQNEKGVPVPCEAACDPEANIMYGAYVLNQAWKRHGRGKDVRSLVGAFAGYNGGSRGTMRSMGLSSFKINVSGKKIASIKSGHRSLYKYAVDAYNYFIDFGGFSGTSMPTAAAFTGSGAVATLGDSIMAKSGIGGHLGRQLGRNVRVIRAGVGGKRSDWILNRYRTKVANSGVSVLVLCGGTNNLLARGKRGKGAQRWGGTIQRALTDMQAIISEATSRGIRVVFVPSFVVPDDIWKRNPRKFRQEFQSGFGFFQRSKYKGYEAEFAIFNKAMERYIDGVKGAHYLGGFENVIVKGRKSASGDLIHLKGHVYAKVAKAIIDSYLSKWLTK